jgi:hypothetical protein
MLDVTHNCTASSALVTWARLGPIGANLRADFPELNSDQGRPMPPDRRALQKTPGWLVIGELQPARNRRHGQWALSTFHWSDPGEH